MNKEEFVFVVENENGLFTVESKVDIEGQIKAYESLDRDLDFETIAKIPESKLHMEITEQDIDWYKPNDVTRQYSDKVILAVIQYLLNH